MTLGILLPSMQLGRLAAQQRLHLLEDDLHDVLPGRERIHDDCGHATLFDLAAELLDDLEVDICLEQRHPDFLDAGVDIFFGQLALRAKSGENVLELIR